MYSVPFLIGPTGIGKTEISVRLAEHLSLEIISADSRQIYRFMDIGTAKPSSKVLNRIPHHFINCLSPGEYYSAGKYGREAREKISEIQGKKNIPLVVGGSGFYIQAIIDGFSEIDAYNQSIRDKLCKRLDKQGIEVLHKELVTVDPDLAKRIPVKDRQRILRGLEVFYTTGKPLSHFQLKKPESADFRPVLIGLDTERDFLYKRINSRVDDMIKSGLVNEVEQLLKMGFSEKDNALNTVGYKEVFQYLQNEIEFKEMIDRIKMNTRRYAKRQLTWFRKDERIIWIKITENSRLENIVNCILEKFKIYQVI